MNPQLEVGAAGGVPGDSGVSRRGDVSGEEMMAEHHDYSHDQQKCKMI